MARSGDGCRAMKRPSFQFYPGDWLNDAALRLCSVGARGLWIDMICLMHQGTDYGFLKVNHKPILTTNLTRLLGATLSEVEGWLDELKSVGVYSVDEAGCIYSKRMVRDEEIRSARAAGGVLGGNPALLSGAKGEKSTSKKVNLPSNHLPTPSSSSSTSSSNNIYVDQASPDRRPNCPHQAIIALYHETLPTAPRVKKWTETRARLMRARWNEDPKQQSLEWWKRFFVYVGESDFLMGRATANGRAPFEVSLDWLVKSDNLAKVVEGRYENRSYEVSA